ncbi:MAG TPA: SDR family NAD(P)-dependent oxidoreductase [Candidatus Acidoferrum sp.]|nr:SDR family NAD(P)-dependent oxidoreductase [Candidatus Acidoferrum sp.]
MKNAIIIGASSGIGRALAVTLSLEGYRVGITARRTQLLLELQAELTGPSIFKTIDVSRDEQAISLLQELIAELGDVELFIVNAGTGFNNEPLEWEPERETIAVNVLGFAAMVNVAVAHLQARGAGHLVGISSIAALRGNRFAPAYNASKAFVSNYLEGVRYRFNNMKLPITVTDVQPGFVDTPMAKSPMLFWVASPQKAALQIAEAIHACKSHVYITRRWRLIAWLMRLIPDVLYSKF